MRVPILWEFSSSPSPLIRTSSSRFTQQIFTLSFPFISFARLPLSHTQTNPAKYRIYAFVVCVCLCVRQRERVRPRQKIVEPQPAQVMRVENHYNKNEFQTRQRTNADAASSSSHSHSNTKPKSMEKKTCISLPHAWRPAPIQKHHVAAKTRAERTARKKKKSEFVANNFNLSV